MKFLFINNKHREKNVVSISSVRRKADYDPSCWLVWNVLSSSLYSFFMASRQRT